MIVNILQYNDIFHLSLVTAKEASLHFKISHPKTAPLRTRVCGRRGDIPPLAPVSREGTTPAEAQPEKERRHGDADIHDASIAGGGCPFRPPHPALEPQDEALP